MMSVNKADEKKGKANTGEIKKDQLIETLDKSQKRIIVSRKQQRRAVYWK